MLNALLMYSGTTYNAVIELFNLMLRLYFTAVAKGKNVLGFCCIRHFWPETSLSWNVSKSPKPLRKFISIT